MAYDETLAERLRDLLVDEAPVGERRMFGGLAFLVDGHMAVAASRDGGLLVRVEPGDSEVLVARDHVGRMVMGGRSMDGWLRVDAEGVAEEAELAAWVERAVAYVRTLPSK